IKINTYCLDNNFKGQPELNYVQNLQEKSQYEIKAAESELFPSIFFRANYNIENGDWYLANPAWSNWYVGVGITIPLFHGGSIHAKIDQARARYKQISETKRQSEINIKVRFESARSNLIYQASHLEATQRILDLAKEALTTAELKYNSGKLSALELIDAEMVWNNAQNNYINNMINYLIATAEIEAICPQAIAE
ncbi:MAG: TolC family protein, partial [bacterium]